MLTRFIVYMLSILTIYSGKAHAQADKNIIQDEWKVRTPDKVSLYVTEFGKGDTIVVIHGGFGAEHSYLLSAFMPFATKHHFVLYDQRGSLRSDCADSLITLSKHIEDLETLRQKLGLQQLTLVTHSMGGFIAMNYIKRYPGKVKKWVLLASPPAKGNFEDLTVKLNEPALARWDRPQVLAELKKYGLEKELKKTYTDKERWTWDRITFAAINLHNVENWKEIKGGPLYFSNKANIATGQSIDFDNWDYTEPIKSQGIAVYILHGDDDYIPYHYHDSWKDSLNARFYLIKNAGHCLWIDNYKEYEKALATALNNK